MVTPISNYKNYSAIDNNQQESRLVIVSSDDHFGHNINRSPAINSVPHLIELMSQTSNLMSQQKILRHNSM